MVAVLAAAIPAVIGGVASLIGSGKANSEAAAARREQAALTREDLALRRQYQARQDEIYGPLERQTVSEVQKNTRDQNVGIISSEIDKAYEDAKRETQANLEQQGTDTSGLQAGLMTGIAVKKASDKAKGVYEAGQQYDAQKLGQKLAVLGRYSPGQDSQFVSGGLMNYANLQGLAAQNASRNAAVGYGSAASILGDLAKYYAKYHQPGLNTTPTGVSKHLVDGAGIDQSGLLDQGGVADAGGITTDTIWG